jgi:hypothetical protein
VVDLVGRIWGRVLVVLAGKGPGRGCRAQQRYVASIVKLLGVPSFQEDRTRFRLGEVVEAVRDVYLWPRSFEKKRLEQSMHFQGK